MKRENPFKGKSFAFAVRVVNAYKFLQGEQREYMLSKRFLRSSTAIDTLYQEAKYGQSSADFVHKLSIAQKEANETLYWLELLHQTDYLSSSQFSSLREEGGGVNQIESIELFFPTLNKQLEIAKILTDIDTEILALESKLAKIQQIKQGMMQSLLTEQIRLVNFAQ